jgi:TonB family protein
MIGDQFLSNLASYSIQVAVIVGLGTLLHYLLRIDAPWLRHAYWRTLLAACLLLPLVQGRQPAPVEAVAAPQIGMAAPVTLTVSMQTGRVSSNAPTDWASMATKALAAGVAFRLLWTAIGLWQLRRLRTAGEPAAAAEHDDLQSLVGTRAEIRYVRSMDQPVTFGAWRPVVILPASLREHPADIRRAVVCHELCHVRRRDWVWVLMEEGIRAVFWFHPAMWWLISRIQLTREEAVDAEVIRATGQRRVYLEALMTFADAAPLTPAAAFSRRRHLFRRILLISKEAVMSSRRIFVSCAASAIVVAAGSWYAVNAFPLQNAPVATAPIPGQRVPVPVQQPAGGAGPLERRAKPITPENPIPRRTYSVPLQYPAQAPEFRGVVSVVVTLDEQGRVAEVRRGTGGLPASANPYIQEVIDAVKQWQYDPPADGPIVFSVIVNVTPLGELTATQVPSTGSAAFFVNEQVILRERAAQAVSRGGGAGEMPLRVGGNVLLPRKITHVNPVYPLIAQSARVQGVVILETVVGSDGTVTDVRVLRSIPLLDQAAIDAVRQWEFEPTYLNGAAVPVTMTTTVQFTLTEQQQ